MKRLWTLLLAALLLAGGLPGKPVRAEEPEISIAVSGEELLPGQSVTITLTVPEDGARRDTTPSTGTEPYRGTQFPRETGS